MIKSTWETCDKPGSHRCRARIAKNAKRIKALEDRCALLEAASEAPTMPARLVAMETLSHRCGPECQCEYCQHNE